MVVIDGQVHVWAAATEHRPWAPGADTYADHVDNLSSATRPPLSPTELSAEMTAAGVDRAVLVPPTFEGDRNDVALAAAREQPDRFAVMGRLGLADPAAADLLPGWCDEPGMLGVRLTFHWGEQQRWLTDGTADWFWPAAQDAGVPVMVYAPDQLDLVAGIAARHPGLSLIVDHFGLPLAARDEHLPEVTAQLVAMAGLPNVAIKASALPSFTRAGYPFRPLHDPIHRVVDAFGPDRVFWGSEMSRLRCSYREAVTLFTDELDFLTGHDLELVMGAGLSAWLGWSA
jgi:L-fuconolactonase